MTIYSIDVYENFVATNSVDYDDADIGKLIVDQYGEEVRAMLVTELGFSFANAATANLDDKVLLAKLVHEIREKHGKTFYSQRFLKDYAEMTDELESRIMNIAARLLCIYYRHNPANVFVPKTAEQWAWIEQAVRDSYKR